MTEKQSWEFYIAGVKFRKSQVAAIMSELMIEVNLALAPEPTNKYDPNAIQLMYTSNVHGETFLGYVPAKISAEVTAAFEIAEGEITAEITELNPKGKTWEWIKVKING